MMLQKRSIVTFTKKHYVSIIIIFLIALQAIQLIHWINNNNINPSWDEAWHLSNTLSYKNNIFHLDYPSNNELAKVYPIFQFGYSIYPHPNPLYVLSAFLTIDYPKILIIQLFFVSLLILSTYGIGKELFGKKVGLLSAFLISTYPLTLTLSRSYLLDLPLASFVALSIFLLIKTKLFQDNKYNLLFILSLIPGILTKQIFPLFVFPAIIYCLVTMYLSKSIVHKKKIKMTFLFSALILSAAISVYLFFPERSILLIKNFFGGFNNLFNIKPYLFTLINLQILKFYFIALLIGGVYFLKTSKHRWAILTILTPIIIMIMANSIETMTNLIKDARYTYPLLYSFALITSAGLNQIKKINLKKAIILLLILLGSLQFMFLAFNPNTQTQNTDLNLILNEINNSGANKTICIIAETSQVNDINIPHYSIKYKYPMEYMTGGGCDPNKFNFVILGPIDKTWRSNLFEKSRSIFEANKDKFEIIGKFSQIELYQKIKI